ncbi:hypothetical protein OXX69_002396 [Metschnikowia pulcherrima]
MSSGSEDMAATPSKPKDTLGWLTDPRKTRQTSPRDSCMSMLSTESYNPSEIGEAVELSVVEEQRGENGPVKQTYVEKTANFGDEMVDPEVAEDEESLFSSSTVQLGRLDTIKSASRPQNPPEITVSTSLDAVIPPRSRRRPVSEIISPSQYPKMGKSNHRHRFSLNISDDLDKLMEKASDLTEPYSSGQTSRNERLVSRSSTTSVSKESFQTADDLSLGEKAEPPLALPKRPNAKNLEKARQISASHAQNLKNHQNAGDAESVLYSSDQQSTRTWSEINKDESQITVMQESRPDEETAAKTPVLRDDASTSEHYPSPSVARGSSTGSSQFQFENGKQSGNQEIPAHRSNSVSTANSWTKLDVSGVLGEPRSQKNPAEVTEKGELAYSAVPSESQMSSQRSSPTPQHVGKNRLRHASQVPSISPPSSANSAKKTQSPGIAGPTNELSSSAEPDKSLPERKVSIVENKQMHRDPNTVSAEDDGFYDIEEPVVISHPARAKSVKDNTRGPARKGSRRKSRRMPKRESESGTSLKPFPYNTLVHLLESMNGTVIGEEFESLNLPMQEKQLIEKVIDSLSRLTSDMVTDNNRYAIGLERLEKAHRVLEGFL